MKRDMDLIRGLLLKIEEAPERVSWKSIVPEDNGEAQRALAHLKLIEEAGDAVGDCVGIR
jgi:hypothetical protein